MTEFLLKNVQILEGVRSGVEGGVYWASRFRLFKLMSYCDQTAIFYRARDFKW